MIDAVEIDANQDGDRLARLIRTGIAVFVVMLVLAMFPLSPQPAIDIKVVIYQLAATVFGGLWLAAVVTGKAPLAWPRIFGPLLVLMLLCHATAIAAAINPAISALELSRTFCMMMLFLVASQVYVAAHDARPLLIAVCIGVAISTLYAFAQKAGLDPFPWDESQLETSTYLEMPGTFGNPNIAGHALILAVILAAYLTTVRSQRWCAVFIPLFASHLYLTNFRAGVLALASGLAVTVLAAGLLRLRRTPIWTARVTVAAALAAATIVATTVIGSVYSASADSRLLDDSILLRYNAYYGAARMIADHPVNGVGPGMYAIENPPYWTEYEQRWLAENHLMNRHVHSDVLEAWVETGIAGALLYVLVLLAGVYFSVQLAARSQGDERRFALALTAFFATYATDGLFGFNSRVPVTAVVLFLMAGVLEGVNRRAPSEQSVSLRTRAPQRVIALVLASLLVVSAVLAARDFVAKALRQATHNAIAFRAFGEADQDSATALRLAPYDPGAHVARAEALLQLGFPDRALREYETASRLRPYDVPILLGFARAQFSSAVDAVKRGDRNESEQAFDRATETADRALRVCPFLPDAHEVLGRIALAKAELDTADLEHAFAQQAEEHLLDAVHNGAKNLGALFTLAAVCRTIAGDEAGSEDFHRKAVTHDPSNPESWKSYLEFAARTGGFDALGTALDRAIARANTLGDQPLGGRLHVWRAQAYSLSGRPSGDVADEFDRALSMAPDTPEIWVDYAEAARASDFQNRFLESVRRVATALPHVAALKTALSDGAAQPNEAAVALHTLAGRVATPGYVELRARDLAWALDYAQDAILDPSAPNENRIESLAHIAAANEVLERLPQAAHTYQLIAEQSSGQTYISAATKTGSLFIALSEFDKAVEILDTAVKQHRNNVPLRLAYAQALAAAGKPAAARLELNALRSQFRLDSDQQAAVDAALEALSP